MKWSDLSASLVVFLVALPLCLGLAIASNAPPSSGLIAGIVGGLVVSPLSGSVLSVSGPTASLAIVIALAISSLGDFQAFLLATFLAGAIQVLMGFMKIGRFSSFFPYPVIRGLLASIGILIILKQIPHALGWDKDYVGEEGLIQGLTESSSMIGDIVKALYSFHPTSVVISLLSIAAMIGWDKFRYKAMWTRHFPGSLLAVGIGLVASLITQNFFGGSWTLSPDHRVSIPDQLPHDLFHWMLPHLPWQRLNDLKIWNSAVMIAFIASIEALLSIEATDQLDPQKRITPKDQELKAQGIGNMVSACFSGLPLTSVIVRSSANISAGAQTKLSAILHGGWLLVAILFFSRALNLIPLASLAAILIYVGYKVAPATLFRFYARQGLFQSLPFFVTIAGILATNLVTGAFIGFALSLVLILVTNTQSAIAYVHDGSFAMIKFTKDVAFYNKVRLKEILREVPQGTKICIDGTKAMFIDDDILQAIHEFQTSSLSKNIKVDLRNIEGRHFPGLKIWKERTHRYGLVQKTPSR